MIRRIKRTLACIIRELRKSKGISQRELAQRSELHINTVHLIEVGEIEVKFSTLLYIAKGLEVNLDELTKLFVNKYFNN